MTTDIDEFGTGVICPFQRDGKGDFVNGGGLRLLASDVKELIGIMGPTRTQPGELPWRTEIGSRAMAMKHRRMHPEMVRATADQMVSATVRKYEKRVTPGQTEIEIEPLSTTMVVKFSYMPLASMGTNQLKTVEFEIEE